MRAAALTLTFVIFATVAHAREVWVVHASGQTASEPCHGVEWRSTTLFHNLTQELGVVRLLHTSSGGLSSGESTLAAQTSAPAAWLNVDPGFGGGLLASKYEVTDGLDVESRLEYFDLDCGPSGHPPQTEPSGYLSMPVVTGLVAAGLQHRHYGTDLGRQPVRLNVLIFNAGPAPATAQVSLRRPFCFDASAVARTQVIPADTVVQVGLGPVQPCLPKAGMPHWEHYVTVTMDQPGFSFVTTLANDTLPAASVRITP